MIRIARPLAILSLCTAPLWAVAEEATPEEGFSLLEQGAKILLRSMMDEVEPALKEMHEDFGAAMDEMGPALRELAAMLGDVRNYEAPVRLPNGDILIRRRPEAPPAPAMPNAPGGTEIEI